MTKCTVCDRDPQSRNSATYECSHVDCPHRRHAWSEQPQPHEVRRHWPQKKFKNEDPKPLDKEKP